VEIGAVSGRIQLWWFWWVSCLQHNNPSGKTWNIYTEANSSNSEYTDDAKILCHCRETNGQASGGDDAANDDWIFNTMREKDLQKFQNGAAQPAELEMEQVRPTTVVEEKSNDYCASFLHLLSVRFKSSFISCVGESKEAFVAKLIDNLFAVVCWGNGTDEFVHVKILITTRCMIYYLTTVKQF